MMESRRLEKGDREDGGDDLAGTSDSGADKRARMMDGVDSVAEGVVGVGGWGGIRT